MLNVHTHLYMQVLRLWPIMTRRETQSAALIACCLFLNLLQRVAAITADSTARLSSAFSLTTKMGREGIQMVVAPAATQITVSCPLPKRISDCNAFTICTAMISKRSLVSELPWSVLLRVTVDDDLHQDLQEIVKSNNECISNTYPPGSFARLFWENQMRASAVSKASSMRWDPLMIRWCLYLRHVSCSAYEMLRETGIVKLPSQRTLRDYTYTAKAAAGFSNEVDTHLLQAAKLDTCPDREKHVILLMDEMHLREDLVYDRHSGLCVPMHTCTRTCTCTYVHV